LILIKLSYVQSAEYILLLNLTCASQFCFGSQSKVCIDIIFKKLDFSSLDF